MFIFSPDGTTPGATRSALPNRFIRKLDGDWSIPTPETAEEFGWYPVTEVPQPSVDHVVSITHDGSGFVQAWTFDQAARDARLASEARQAKATAVDNAVVTLRTWATQAASTVVTNGNNTQVTQTLVDRLGVFFDRFADLVESRQL